MSNRKRSNLGMMAPSGYQVPRSLRFRESASAYLSRTPAQAGNRRTWTFSGWVKRGSLGGDNSIFTAYGNGSQSAGLYFSNDTSADKLEFYTYYSGGWQGYLITSQIFRDPAAWMHIVAVLDTTQAQSSTTASDSRMRLYVNGTQITNFSSAVVPSQNTDAFFNQAQAHHIGRLQGNAYYYDGQISEVNFIDGQALAPSYFGETSDAGQWIPKKYAGTYGTNGFFLDFSDNSAVTTSSNVGLGKDFSGNGNYWTTNNISVTAGVTYDSMLDVPGTAWGDGGNGRGNYCTLNPLDRGNASTSLATNANLTFSKTGANFAPMRGTFAVTSGKWYFEFTCASSALAQVGVSNAFAITPASGDVSISSTGSIGAAWDTRGYIYHTGTSTAYAYTYTTNDVVMCAFDYATGKIWFGKNGTWNTGDPAAGTSAAYTASGFNVLIPFFNGESGGGGSANFGQRPFSYTPPTGFKTLNSLNLPEPTILQGNRYMDIDTYTGTGATRTKTGLYFQPDLAWFKGRSGATDHALYDVVRGVQKDLASNLTAAETTQSTGLTAFTSDGYTTGALAKLNTSAATYVNWLFKAGGTATNNTSGSITSSVSAGVAQGISVLTYTGTGAAATVGHGLGVAPSFIVCKRYNGGNGWDIWHKNIGAGYGLDFTTAASSNPGAGILWPTVPSSTLIYLGTGGGENTSGGSHIIYAFTDVAGFSAFGSYVGNANADGPFVHLGFRPRWVLIKGTAGALDWQIIDTTRDSYNLSDRLLYPNLTAVEGGPGGGNGIDIASNGFKLRSANANSNTNSTTFIYAAFAENPFKYCNAR